MAPFEKSRAIFFVSSIIKIIFPFPSQSILPVKIICCISFVSASSFCSLLQINAITLWYFLTYGSFCKHPVA